MNSAPTRNARNFTMRWNATTRPMPTTATGYMGLGRNLSAQKQWTEAIKQFTYAASLGSDNAYPYAFRAEAYKELGEWDKSADDIITALSIEFNNKAVSLLSDIKEPMLSIVLAKMKIQIAK